jgi:hypothetical protein
MSIETGLTPYGRLTERVFDSTIDLVSFTLYQVQLQYHDTSRRKAEPHPNVKP